MYEGPRIRVACEGAGIRVVCEGAGIRVECGIRVGYEQAGIRVGYKEPVSESGVKEPIFVSSLKVSESAPISICFTNYTLNKLHEKEYTYDSHQGCEYSFENTTKKEYTAK